MLGAITDEIMCSYGIAVGTIDWRVKHIATLRNALRDVLARALQAECYWEYEKQENPPYDSRLGAPDEYWQAEAERRLTKGE